jgi:hypothetical protein
MYLQKLRFSSFLYQLSLSHYRLSKGTRNLWFGLLALLLAYSLVWPLPIYADNPLVTQEIRYHMPEAGEVTLIWGINGWHTLPEETQPAGTTVKNGTIRTPTIQERDTFIAKVNVPTGVTLDYGFLITKAKDGSAVEIWDGNNNKDYHTTIKWGDVTNIRFTTQEIRYYLPQAHQVTLVWGINDWGLTPKLIRPTGTQVQNELMYTPMIREDDTFVARVRTPVGETLDYKFLITEESSNKVWDANNEEKQGYHTTTMPGGVIGIKRTPILSQGETPNTVIQVGLYMLAGVIVVAGLGVVLYLIPLPNSQAVALVLLGLTLLGLSLRLWLSWNTQPQPLDWSTRLSSNELSYLELADLIRQGSFLQASERLPIYPLFLAVCYLILGHSYALVFYVQACIGAVGVCLTFLLARHFTGTKLSLLAAALVALHPALILQTTRFSAEVLYTSLLLLTFLGLLGALTEPQPRRFITAGLLLAVTNLCYSTMLLFPIALLVLLPNTLSLRHKIKLSLSYATATIGIILFLSYQNYRTNETFWPLSMAGTSLWWGSPELYYLMQDQQPPVQIWNRYLNPASNGGYDPFTIEGKHYFAQRALKSISNYPGTYILYSFLKLPFFWVGHPAIDWPDYTIFNLEAMRPYFSVPRIAGILVTRILPLFVLIGLIILHELHGRVRTVVPLLVICSYFMLIYAITYPEMRYIEPLHPLLLTIIVTAIKPKEYTSLKFATRWQGQQYYSYP